MEKTNKQTTISQKRESKVVYSPQLPGKLQRPAGIQCCQWQLTLGEDAETSGDMGQNWYEERPMGRLCSPGIQEQETAPNNWRDSFSKRPWCGNQSQLQTARQPWETPMAERSATRQRSLWAPVRGLLPLFCDASGRATVHLLPCEVHVPTLQSARLSTRDGQDHGQTTTAGTWKN